MTTCQKCGKEIGINESVHISDYGKITQCDPCFQKWAEEYEK
jgi:uncharacterized OB-fold protein